MKKNVPLEMREGGEVEAIPSFLCLCVFSPLTSTPRFNFSGKEGVDGGGGRKTASGLMGIKLHSPFYLHSSAQLASRLLVISK